MGVNLQLLPALLKELPNLKIQDFSCHNCWDRKNSTKLTMPARLAEVAPNLEAFDLQGV